MIENEEKIVKTHKNWQNSHKNDKTHTNWQNWQKLTKLDKTQLTKIYIFVTHKNLQPLKIWQNPHKLPAQQCDKNLSTFDIHVNRTTDEEITQEST